MFRVHVKDLIDIFLLIVFHLLPLLHLCGSDSLPSYSSPRSTLTDFSSSAPQTSKPKGRFCSIEGMFCIPGNYSKFNPPSLFLRMTFRAEWRCLSPYFLSSSTFSTPSLQ